MNAVEQFIESNWANCIKYVPEDNDSLFGLPYPFTVPAVGHFNELYYWDTYFTNVGLLASGQSMQAKHNIDDILCLIKRFGYMPNGSREGYLGRTQPPFSSVMVRDVYEFYGDKVWFLGAYETLKTEYDFWMENRQLPIGLNTYGGILRGTPEQEAIWFGDRIGFAVDVPPEILGKHIVASYESGWDISPRFGFELYNCAPVDLNSLLYLFEINMAYFSEELQKGEEENWKNRAQKRKELMRKYLKNEEGLFLDYNIRTHEHSKIFSVASIYPMFAELVNEEEKTAICKNFPRLEYDFGVSTCEKNDAPGAYQWDYPNGWPCLQYIVMKAFLNYGMNADAKRIAQKYVTVVDKVFEQNGNLWEKYNVVEGNINVTNEYEMPPMMGWSAGIYLESKRILKEEL